MENLVILSIVPWLMSLVVLVTVLYAIALLRRITLAIERIAEGRK